MNNEMQRICKECLEDTYIITMQTKNDKTLYLSMWGKKPQWTFDKQDACIWQDINICKKFGNKWFKNYKGWVIREHNSMEIVED